jgi:hypothetical protein
MESWINNEAEVTSDKFNEIADLMMNKSILKINGSSYRICEIEFYLNDKQHPDTYTHSNPDQSEYGFWYHHKFGNGAVKSGTFKGLDLTLGSAKKNKYCGILIRSIYDVLNDTFIEGPCLCVNKILELYGTQKIGDFAMTKKSVLKNDYQLIIKDDSTLKQEKISAGPRIGLGDKNPLYKDRPYRYVIYKNKIKKQKRSLIDI